MLLALALAPPLLGLSSRQSPPATIQPDAIESTGTTANGVPEETDVWADPAPVPKGLGMAAADLRSGVEGTHSPAWKVGANGPFRKGGPGLDVYDVPTDECGVSVYRNDDGRLEVFAVGPDDQIYHKAQRQTRKPEQWTNWTCLGGPTRSGPSVARDPLGRLFLAVQFNDGSYRFRSQRSKPKEGTGAQATVGMSDWVSLGGKFSSKPEVIRDSEGFLHVFGRGVDQQVYHRYQMAYPDGPRTRVKWDSWVHMGGPASSAPSVLLDHESMLNVFIRGGDRQLWRVRQVSVLAEKSIVRWGEWEPLGGVLASAPRVANLVSSMWLVMAVIRGADKGMWMRQQTSSLTSGVGWGEWTNLQGVLTQAPAVIAGEDGTVDVLARGTDRRVYLKHRQLTAQGSVWGEWEDLGGTATVSPAVERNDDGMLRVFIRMPDRAIYMRTQTTTPQQQLGPNAPELGGASTFGRLSANASGALWTNWISLGGNTKAFQC
jgi:hypothetical protein